MAGVRYLGCKFPLSVRAKCIDNNTICTYIEGDYSLFVDGEKSNQGLILEQELISIYEYIYHPFFSDLEGHFHLYLQL